MPQEAQQPANSDRTPYNEHAEQAALAAMILDENVAEEAVLMLRAECFFKVAHRTIFTAIQELISKGKSVDQIILADKLDAMGKLKEIGGREYILTIADQSFALANWASHVNIIKNDSLLRDLIKANIEIKSLAENASDDAAAVVAEAERLIIEATESSVRNDFVPLKSLLVETMSVLEDRAENKGKVFGVPSGFKELDKLLGGFRPGDLVVLAARPSIGKTALALNIAINAAKAETSIAFFSLEMPSQQVVERLCAAETGINLSSMRQGFITETDFEKLIVASNELGKYSFVINDQPSMTMMEIRANARRALRGVKDGMGLIVIDYLNLIQPSRRGNNIARYLEVAEVTGGLKILAKELGVPILALSQLSRGFEQRSDKIPQLSDLRESGSIEQDADVVLFLDRSKTQEEAMDTKRPEFGTARIIVGKNRNGPIGVAETVFSAETTTFRDKYRG